VIIVTACVCITELMAAYKLSASCRFTVAKFSAVAWSDVVEKTSRTCMC